MDQVVKTQQPMRRSDRYIKNNKEKNVQSNGENNKKWYKNWNWNTWSRKRKIWTTILLLLVIASFFLYFIPTQRAKQPLSFLIVGTDTDTYREENYSGRKPKRTDAIMVATFNPKTYNVEMTSIPRDTSVDYACKIDGRQVRGPINEIYEVSGRKIDCLRSSVSKFLNVPIDYYALIDMSQLQKIIDEIGGITVDVHAKDGSFCQVTTDVSKKYCFKNGDVEQMNGEEAVVYARFRKDSEKDYGRGMRQQQVISAMLSKITSEKKFNSATVGTLLSSVKTDISPVLLAKYYTYFKHMSNVGQMVSGQAKPGKGGLPNKAWERIFEKVDLKGQPVTNATINKAIETIKTKPEYVASPLQLFFTNHQFFNDTYAGFYVTPPNQREEISNALRANLGLKAETPKDYEYEFGRYDLPTDEEAFFGDEQHALDTLPDENSIPENQPTNNKPIITGPDQYQINVGESFTPQLSASDQEDGSVQVYLVSSNLNTSVPGQYQQVYEARDSQGNVSDRYIIYITVVGKQQEEQTPPQAETIPSDQVQQDNQGRYIYKDSNGTCWIVVDESGSGQFVKKQQLSECPID